MSDKIYFSAGRKRLLSKALHLGLSLAHRFSPNATRRRIGKLLLTPARRAAKPGPAGISQQRLTVRNGEICRYSLGEGPALLLIHGWSGAASQFFPLMEKLAAAGFTAITYDQIGHGNSGGRQTNLPCFIHTLEDVLAEQQEQQPLAGIIGHSMGAVAAINVLADRHPALPLAMLAPAFGLKRQMYERVTQAGIPRPLLKGLFDDIAAHSGLHIDQLQAEDKLAGYRGPLAIIHDREDPMTPHDLSRTVAEQHRIPLITTQGFGHNRLLAADPVWQALRQWLDGQPQPAT